MSRGVSINWRMANDPFAAHLHKLSQVRLDGLKREIGEYLVGQIQDRFDEQRLIDGSVMPQSKAALARSGQTLIDRRLLYKSYVYAVLPGGVEVGSDSAYARIHHEGGETGRPGHRFEMEARPVMGENQEDDDWIGDLILEELGSMA